MGILASVIENECDYIIQYMTQVQIKTDLEYSPLAVA